MRGAAHLATRAGISPLAINLTIVAMGISAPRLTVSLRANLVGQAEPTLGNVVGSNIANMLLIRGLTAVTAPLLVDPRVLQREAPILMTLRADAARQRGLTTVLAAGRPWTYRPPRQSFATRAVGCFPHEDSLHCAASIGYRSSPNSAPSATAGASCATWSLVGI